MPRLQARGELREMHSREEGGDVVLQGVRVLWYEIEWCPDQVGSPLVARSRLEADLHSLRARGVPIFDPARRYRLSPPITSSVTSSRRAFYSLVAAVPTWLPQGLRLMAAVAVTSASPAHLPDPKPNRHTLQEVPLIIPLRK